MVGVVCSPTTTASFFSFSFFFFFRSFSLFLSLSRSLAPFSNYHNFPRSTHLKVTVNASKFSELKAQLSRSVSAQVEAKVSRRFISTSTTDTVVWKAKLC